MVFDGRLVLWVNYSYLTQVFWMTDSYLISLALKGSPDGTCLVSMDGLSPP